MTPSVRGRGKGIVASLLAGSAVSTGALVGFAVGVAWAVAGLPALGRPAVIAIVVVAVALDLADRWAWAPRPPSVGRQVPREWSRLFSPPTVAVLYGARLGVGPATILSTWLWWAALVVGASAGVWTSVAVGAAFGLVRTLLMIALGEWVRHRAAPRMARVRAAEGIVALTLVPLAVAAAMLAS